MNPVMRVVLRTVAGRLVSPFALLEFEGRRTGRRYRVPVGWHVLDDGPAVVTPAGWRANFRTPRPVTIWHRGHRTETSARLVADPLRVAAALQEIVDARGSLRSVGVHIEPGRPVTADDVRQVDRGVLRFGPAPPRPEPPPDRARASPRGDGASGPQTSDGSPGR